MLINVPALIGGTLLCRLDQLGHGDALVIADANFPSYRIAASVEAVRGVSGPEFLTALQKLLPIDLDEPCVLMTADGDEPAVQHEYRAALPQAAVVESIDRFDFYRRAAGAQLIVHTGEVRPYGNLIVHKGVVTAH